MRHRSQSGGWFAALIACLACAAASALEREAQPPIAPIFEAQTSAANDSLLRARGYLEQQDFHAARESFEAAVGAIEVDDRASPAALIEALAGLATSLHGVHRYEAAIAPARRALILIRSREGLYAQQQRALLEILIDAQSQLGLIEETSGDLGFLERVNAAAGEGSALRQIASLTNLGDWYCRIGEFTVGRARHHRAIQALERAKADRELLEARLGLARCSLHELSSQGIKTADGVFEQYRGPIIRAPSFAVNRIAYRHQLGLRLRVEGEQALRDAARQALRSATLDARTKADTLLLAGDWFQLKGFTKTARDYYAKAAQVLGAAAKADDRLDAPVRVLYPIPPLALRAFGTAPPKRSERYLIVAFTVRADGTVETPRVIERNVPKSMVDQTLDALLSTRYRPRVVDGEPVVSHNVTLRQSFDDPRELSGPVAYSNAE